MARARARALGSSRTDALCSRRPERSNRPNERARPRHRERPGLPPVGGHGATMATQLAVVAELGCGCSSTAWVQQILNVTTWGAARSKGGTELFEQAKGGARPPSGKATPAADGGYVVSGQWAFASGSFYASWFNAGVLALDEAGKVVGPGLVMPLADLTIDDTWCVAGMCGAASNTVVADVLVPASRITLVSDGMAAGDEPADRWPIGSVLALALPRAGWLPFRRCRRWLELDGAGVRR